MKRPKLIYITSFKKVANVSYKLVYSSAVYQPKGFIYDKAEWADIRNSKGRWTRPREFIEYPEPLQAYRDALWKLYLKRESKIKQWLKRHAGKAVVLCCWCPYERAAQRQLKQYGSYACHTAVIGKFLETRFKCKIKYDKDRDKMVKF